jgi:hypothetical protein
MVNPTPWPLYPQQKAPVPTVQEAGWPQGRSGRVWKISPPAEFDPRTVQPVASRYTDYAVTDRQMFSTGRHTYIPTYT